MISLVITEDQLMLRKAMVQLIEMHEEMNVIKDFENGVEALEFIENNEPNVAILDLILCKKKTTQYKNNHSDYI